MSSMKTATGLIMQALECSNHDPALGTPEFSCSLAALSVQIELLSCQREIRDTLKMIDHRVANNAINKQRSPVAQRIAGLMHAKHILEANSGLYAIDAIKDIDEAIQSLRSQMEIGE
jgi:hypothetical protein